jgi:hypothetical protein
MHRPLSDADISVIRETLAEIRAAPPPRDFGGAGCAVSVLALALLLGFPALGRKLAVGTGTATTVLVAGGVLLIVGIVLRLTAGGFVRGHAIAAAEAALRVLEAGEGDRETQLRAATLLLCHAFATYGPTTSEAFDFAAARARVGARLELVTAVEAFLLAEKAIYPVFSSGDTADQGGAPA